MNYQSPQQLQAVILDWAGTMVDFGSFAPTQVFVEAFAEFGVTISLEEARGPMGMSKWDHIHTLCQQAEIAERFITVFGRAPDDADVTAIYERFMPLQLARVADHAALIPGALEAVEQLRSSGLKIGSDSGYPRVIMDKLAVLAADQGYRPDHLVAGDDLPRGRPCPAQALANAIALQVDDVAACVKVDDTLAGVLEGRYAGMWTVAVRFSGNLMGLTYAQYQALDDVEKQMHRRRIDALFAAVKPHVLIDTVADLPAAIVTINKHLAGGGQLAMEGSL